MARNQMSLNDICLELSQEPQLDRCRRYTNKSQPADNLLNIAPLHINF